jgi:hypothetical protein
MEVFMTWNISTGSNRDRPSAKLVARNVLFALFAFGAFVGAAKADGNWDQRRNNYRSWNDGYYRAPPVVYGSRYATTYYGAPSYYPPPVIYGPGVGFNIQIR